MDDVNLLTVERIGAILDAKIKSIKLLTFIQGYYNKDTHASVYLYVQYIGKEVVNGIVEFGDRLTFESDDIKECVRVYNDYILDDKEK